MQPKIILPDGMESTRRFPVVDQRETYWSLLNSPTCVNFMEKGLYMKYVGMTMKAKAEGIETPPELIKRVCDEHLQYAREVKTAEEMPKYEAAFERTWPKMEAALRQNLGMAHAMLELGACRSLIFYAALVWIVCSETKSSPLTLEVTYERGLDITGKVITAEPKDEIVKVTALGAIFVCMRYRDLIVLERIKRTSSIISVGSGVIRELRAHGGLPLSELRAKEFVAVDRDTSLKWALDPLFKAYYDTDFAGTGIKKHWCDFGEIFAKKEYQNHFEFVFSAGTYSYQTKLAPKEGGGMELVPDDEATLRLIRGCMDLACPGGTVFFDAQVAQKDMLLETGPFNWTGSPQMLPGPNLNVSSARFTRLLAQVDGVENFQTVVDPIRQAGMYWIIKKAG